MLSIGSGYIGNDSGDSGYAVELAIEIGFGVSLWR